MLECVSMIPTRSKQGFVLYIYTDRSTQYKIQNINTEFDREPIERVGVVHTPLLGPGVAKTLYQILSCQVSCFGRLLRALSSEVVHNLGNNCRNIGVQHNGSV
jgi:hypothetical protein